MKDVLQQYAALRTQLIKERGSIQSRLAEIDRVIGSTPANLRPHSRGRTGPQGDNSMTMRDGIKKALRAGPMKVRQIVEALQRLGYKFRSKNPTNSVGVFLYTHKNLFKNPRRGVFTLK